MKSLNTAFSFAPPSILFLTIFETEKSKFEGSKKLCEGKIERLLTFYVHCAKEGHKLECFKENRNVFVEIDRGESLITADIPCKYGADPPFASTVPPTGSPHILISAVPSDIKNSAVNIFRWNQPTS